MNSVLDEYSIFLESIKCHHIDIANYFADNYVDYLMGENTKNLENTLKECLECYYFVDINENYINPNYFYEMCNLNYLNCIKRYKKIVFIQFQMIFVIKFKYLNI